MASSVSILNNYKGSLFQFKNKDLLLKGLMMKQQKYDVAKEALRQTRLSDYGLNVAKDVDKEYLDGRIEDATNMINESLRAHGDLSNDNYAGQLINKFHEVVDDNVYNAVYSTSKRRSEASLYQAAKERNDGTYSPINEMVASKQWRDYMQNQNVGVKYSGSAVGYVPYSDPKKKMLSKEFNQVLKDNNLNVEYKETSDGEYGFVNTATYKGTPRGANFQKKLRAVVDAYLTPEDHKQMQINAIHTFGWGDTQESVDALKQTFDSEKELSLEGYRRSLKSIDLQLENKKLTPDQKETLKGQKQFAMDKISGLDRNYEDIVGSPDGTVDQSKFLGLAYSIYGQKEKEKLFNLAYKDPVLTDTNINEITDKILKHQEWAKDYELRKNKDLREQAKLASKLRGGTEAPGQGGQGTVVMPDDGSINEGSRVKLEELERDVQSIIYNKYTETIDKIKASSEENGVKLGKNELTELKEGLIGIGGSVPGRGTKIKVGDGKYFTVTKENEGAVADLVSTLNGQSEAGMVAHEVEKVLNLGFDSEGANILDWSAVSRKGAVTEQNPIYFEKEGDNIVQKRGLISEAQKLGFSNNISYIADKIVNGKALTEGEQVLANMYKYAQVSDNVLDGKAEKKFGHDAMEAYLHSKGVKLRYRIGKETPFSKVGREKAVEYSKSFTEGYKYYPQQSDGSIVGNAIKEAVKASVSMGLLGLTPSDPFLNQSEINSGAQTHYENAVKTYIEGNEKIATQRTLDVRDYNATQDKEQKASAHSRFVKLQDYAGISGKEKVGGKTTNLEKITLVKEFGKIDEEGNRGYTGNWLIVPVYEGGEGYEPGGDYVKITPEELEKKGVSVNTKTPSNYNLKLEKYAAETTFSLPSNVLSNNPNESVVPGNKAYYSNDYSKVIEAIGNKINTEAGFEKETGEKFDVWGAMKQAPSELKQGIIHLNAPKGVYGITYKNDDGSFVYISAYDQPSLYKEDVQSLRNNTVANYTSALQVYLLNYAAALADKMKESQK